jgi:phosphopantothenoylcysteine decarboxylase/phosphopantothenate--cysteine ligase
VTAGPTYEPLDEARRLTNFSTGRLGSELAGFLSARGHSVTLLIGEQASWGGERRARQVETFSTTEDMRSRLRALSADAVDAVFHAAAVSDFCFGKVWQGAVEGELKEIKAGKISSRIDRLLVELLPTPKIIGELRGFFPRALIVGWKFEVDGDRPGVIAKGREQIFENRTNACVVNGRAYGSGFGLVSDAGLCPHFADKESLFAALENRMVQ